MIQVTMQEVEENVLQLIQQAIEGEEIVILSNNLPVVKLSAINGKRKPRVPGSAKGLIHMADDFDEPDVEMLIPGENRAAAKLTAAGIVKRPPVFGSAKQFLVQMTEDFDEPPEDFTGYV